MALTLPPRVFIVDTWQQTEWDDSPEGVAAFTRGSRSMSVREVDHWRWRIDVPGVPVRYCRLLVAGSAAPATPGAVVVPAGRHRPTVEVREGSALAERSSSDAFDVTP